MATSIKDVAKVAGVSFSTVSRVLSQKIPVEEKTRRKVEEALKKVNYKPNLLAKGLKTKSGKIIGLVVPEISHEYFSTVIGYVEKYVTQSGYGLFLGNTKGDPEIEEKIIGGLIGRHVDGIIFLAQSAQERLVKILDNSNTLIVFIDRTLENKQVNTVLSDNYKIGRMAAEYLLSLGHKKIFCITGPFHLQVSQLRLKGFKDALEEHNVSLAENYVFKGDFEFKAGFTAAKQIVKNKLDMTAVWGQNDLMAIAAMVELQRKGFKIPEDISMMGVDNVNLSQVCNPPLTTINQPLKAMCQKAVEMVIQAKNEPESAPKEIVIAPKLVIRKSTLKRN